MDWVQLLISVISGIAGGNIAGSAMKDSNNLGGLGNSIAGFFGGGIGGYILQALGLLGASGVAAATGSAPDAAHFDIGHLIGNIAGSGVGGAILTMIVSYIKNAMNKP